MRKTRTKNTISFGVDLLVLRRDPRHLLQTQPNEIDALPNEQNLLRQIVGEISWQHGVLKHIGLPPNVAHSGGRVQHDEEFLVGVL